MGRVRLGCVVAAVGILLSPVPAGAAPSPQLGTIAFESERLGPTDLFMMRPDGTGISRLNTPGGGSDASWSPDGRRIAFSSDPEGDGDVDIFVMNVDGTELRQLTNSPGLDAWPDWFRGGRQIAFASDRSGLPHIYVMSADGSEQRQLTDEPGTANLTPVVSPSGRHIAFARATPVDPPKIWIMNADGTDQHALTSPGPGLALREDNDPAWSIDGRQIAFSRRTFGSSSEIFIMGTDGSSPTALTNEPGADLTPTFSPDNRYIAWTAARGGNFDVWVMNRDGSGKTRLTTHPAFDGFPDWHQTRAIAR